MSRDKRQSQSSLSVISRGILEDEALDVQREGECRHMFRHSDGQELRKSGARNRNALGYRTQDYLSLSLNVEVETANFPCCATLSYKYTSVSEVVRVTPSQLIYINK